MDTLEQKWRRRFENFGEGYEEDYLISGWSEQGLRQRMELLKANLSSLPDANFTDVLDLGCGPGTYVRYLCGNYQRVVGLDYSIPSLLKARGKDQKKKGIYIGGDAYALPFKENAFDLILSIGTLQSMEKPEKVINEIKRVLRPNGILILEFLNYFDFVNFSLELFSKIIGRPPRVRSYSWFEVKKLFMKNQIHPFLRKGIFLLPRNMVFWNFILQSKPVSWMMNKSCLFSAHAFLIFGENIKNGCCPHRLARTHNWFL